MARQLPIADYRSAVRLDEPFVANTTQHNKEDINKLLTEVLSYFYQERTGSPLPPDASDEAKPKMLASILTMRKPRNIVPDDILHKLDIYLQHKLQTRTITTSDDIPSFASTMKPEQLAQLDPSVASFLSRVSVWKGDITALGVDAIVNAANTQMLGCFIPNHACIDNVIHDKAGPQLRRDCYEFMKLQGENEETGQAKITRAYNLPSKYVLHTVGPIVESGLQPTPEQEKQLESSYIECLEITKERPDIFSIAFCCISTGVFGFPQMRAAEIAVATVKKWLDQQQGEPIKHVVFNVFKEADHAFYIAALEQLAGVSMPPATYNVPLHSNISTAIDWLKEADNVLIAAGAGLSASAGLDYTSKEVFARLFPAMARKGFSCMYEFIGYTDWSPELKWGYLLSQVNLSRFNWPKSDVYDQLKRIGTHKKDYFVITSNADGMFVQNDFPPAKVYTPQGDYSHLQCLKPCKPELFPIKPFIDAALPHIDSQDSHEITKEGLIPTCKHCGGPVFMNVRGGNWFLETPHQTQREEYTSFVTKALANAQKTNKKLVILEIGVGFNTPGVIRWPNERLAHSYPEHVRLIRVNNDRPDFRLGELENTIGIPLDATPAVRLLSKGLGLN